MANNNSWVYRETGTGSSASECNKRAGKQASEERNRVGIKYAGINKVEEVL